MTRVALHGRGHGLTALPGDALDPGLWTLETLDLRWNPLDEFPPAAVEPEARGCVVRR